WNISLNPLSIVLLQVTIYLSDVGKDVSLECSNDANPAANRYRWYWNRKAMPREASKILFLRKVQVKHSGEYHCKASNIISEGASQPVNLAVYSTVSSFKPPRNPVSPPSSLLQPPTHQSTHQISFQLLLLWLQSSFSSQLVGSQHSISPSRQVQPQKDWVM
uniref:Ig-like domain-containing protein n=1 Tax=Varanus komodoensis TaxID=61221 RepID=A0A8D2KUG4_VARKO